MNGLIRALPIRVPPMPGEALDSWLEALATRLDTPLTHMLDALGLSRHDRASQAGPPPNWTIHLTQHEAAHLGAATGVNAQTLRDMTLSRWAGHFLALDPAARTVNVRSSWTRARGSRYCPLCLADTGGRWQLTWRLTWHFACLDHAILLQARCGGCGRMPRELGHALSAVPVPGSCSLPGPDAAKASHRTPCGFPLATCNDDLNDIDVQSVLASQRLISDLIDSCEGPPHREGIYRHSPIRSAEVLHDLRVVASLILRLPVDMLEHWAPPQLLARHSAEVQRNIPHGNSGRIRPLSRPLHMVPVDAAVTAQVLTTAVDIVAAPDLATAASRLGWIVDRLSTFQPLALRPPLLTSRLSAPLAAAMLRARESHFSVARRLKYTTSSLYARRADRSPATLNERAARLPALLWPNVSIPLIPDHDRGARRWRLALPACLLLTGGQMTGQQAVHLLGYPARHSGALSYTHAKINTHPARAAILRALTELAEHLNQDGSLIDYARRRALFANQGEFITLHYWSSLRTRRRSDFAQTHIHAQRWLYEALTGSPAEIAPSQIAANDCRSRTAYSTFRMRLLPSETKLLQKAGAELLHSNGIDEPLTWQPTFRFSPDQLAALPGRDPDAIDITAVHQAFLQDSYPSAKQIATACETTSELVRYILDAHPVDRPILTIGPRS